MFYSAETFQFTENIFQSNRASQEGGAISYQLQRPSMINNYFFNNSAGNYGDDISSYATKIFLFYENGSLYSLIPGNITLRPSEQRIRINVAFFDIDNQLVNISDKSLEFHLDSNFLNQTATNQIKRFSLIGETEAFMRNGILAFSHLNYEISSLLNKETIVLFLKAEKTSSWDSISILNIFIDGCLPGEVFNPFRGKCIECQLGSFSYSPADTKCKSCPTEATFCNLNVRDLKPGYWASPYTQNIYKCAPFVEGCL